MLRIGLTGGIGSGKSTVSRLLAGHGAVLVDADALARAVLAPGTPGAAEVAEVFGPGVVGADGAIDRTALAARVFADDTARQRLNAIVHPQVARRRAALVAEAAADAVVVEDVPLLVEVGLASSFPLVVVVHADPRTRVARLLGTRDLDEAQVRARMDAQASDDERRAVADVWLDNDGSPETTAEAVELLWHRRLVPFERALRTGVLAASSAGGAPTGADPVARARVRIGHVLGDDLVAVDPDTGSAGHPAGDQAVGAPGAPENPRGPAPDGEADLVVDVRTAALPDLLAASAVTGLVPDPARRGSDPAGPDRSAGSTDRTWLRGADPVAPLRVLVRTV